MLNCYSEIQHGKSPGWGVLGISSDRGDRRIFWGFKFSIPGFFWVGKFGKCFLGGGLIYSETTSTGGTRGLSANQKPILKQRDQRAEVNFLSNDFWGSLLEALGMFLGFDFCGSPFDHSHHLKAGVPPWRQETLILLK